MCHQNAEDRGNFMRVSERKNRELKSDAGNGPAGRTEAAGEMWNKVAGNTRKIEQLRGFLESTIAGKKVNRS